jgi:phosphoglycolate phosphatase-like HAD superfamily hydrolase
VSYDRLGIDLDGVLADSAAATFRSAADVAALFGVTATVASMRDYRDTFAGLEESVAAEPVNREALRTMQRLMMRAKAGRIPRFDAVLDLLPRARVPITIISSAMRGTVLGVIGDRAPGHAVLAHEDGPKDDNLARWSAGQRAIYITDNIRDIERCRRCGVSSIAVSWGFDDIDDLRAARPDWFVRDAADLDRLLQSLNHVETNHDRTTRC